MAKNKESIKIVPDTSVVIEGYIIDDIESGELKNPEIILPEFVFEELRAQASKGKEIGFQGLNAIKKFNELHEKGKIKFSKVGRRQTAEEIAMAKSGRVDALIVDVAKEHNAILYTGDRVQALAAEAEGVEVKYYEPYEQEHVLVLEKMMKPDMMSLHLKEDCIPLAKQGKLGEMKLVPLRNTPMTTDEMEEIIREVMDAARYKQDTFLEIGSHAASVVQLGNMRIAIARRPFSDGLEVTVVRPVMRATLEDYKLADKLKERLESRAEGILISGPPGSGKSTFAAALAEFYLNKNKVVKTIESPRDLQVPKEVTQYGPLDGDFVKTADILLLVRPDYTVYDEVRKTKDFQIFADLRLSGVGMIGVVHATQPVDAIQRFMGRVELGVIPHVVDTVVFIRAGKVEKVYELKLVVRTPSGMTEADLARPLIEVTDFETGKPEYEIYTYGEEKVVVPVTSSDGKRESGVRRLALEKIKEELRMFDRDLQVEFKSDDRIIVRVKNDAIPKLIGKEGKMISKIEKDLGVGIDVMPKVESLGREVDYKVQDSGAYIVLHFDKKFSGKNVNLYVDGKFLLTATVGREGSVRISKDSELGDVMLSAMSSQKDVKAVI